MCTSTLVLGDQRSTSGSTRAPSFCFSCRSVPPATCVLPRASQDSFVTSKVRPLLARMFFRSHHHSFVRGDFSDCRSNVRHDIPSDVSHSCFPPFNFFSVPPILLLLKLLIFKSETSCFGTRWSVSFCDTVSLLPCLVIGVRRFTMDRNHPNHPSIHLRLPANCP
jgi:hypothetical protein